MITLTPDLPNFERFTLPPGRCGRFDLRGKNELKGMWSNFTPWLRVLSNGTKTVWGGCCTSFGELGLTTLYKVDRHVNATKSYLQFGRSAGDAVLWSKTQSTFVVRCF